jgi:glycopeptide antibiotics resistance protein
MAGMRAMRPSWPVVWRVVWVGTVVFIVLATTWPWTDFRGHTHWGKVEWVPFTHRIVARDLLPNVLLFAPFGFAGRRAWPETPTWLWVASACGLSFAVETYQLFSHSRFPTSVDLLANTAGAWVGVRRAESLSESDHVWQM